MRIITIASAVIRRPSDGKILLVRKAGAEAFMQAGGKIDAGETPLQALIRELKEELDLDIPAALPQHLGHFESPAANEPGFTVAAEIFTIELECDPAPNAELEELIWVDAAQTSDLTLAPLTRDHILPAILK